MHGVRPRREAQQADRLPSPMSSFGWSTHSSNEATPGDQCHRHELRAHLRRFGSYRTPPTPDCCMRSLSGLSERSASSYQLSIRPRTAIWVGASTGKYSPR